MPCSLRRIPCRIQICSRPRVERRIACSVSSTRMSSSTTKRPRTVRRDSPQGWKPALIAAAFVLTLGTAAYATAWVTRGGAGPVAAETAAMQVTWDGDACTYEGPRHLIAGDGQVIVVRSPAAEDAAILSMRLTDGAVGPAEIQDWAAGHSAQAIPPFVAWTNWDSVYLAERRHAGDPAGDVRHGSIRADLQHGA